MAFFLPVAIIAIIVRSEVAKIVGFTVSVRDNLAEKRKPNLHHRQLLDGSYPPFLPTATFDIDS